MRNSWVPKLAYLPRLPRFLLRPEIFFRSEQTHSGAEGRVSLAVDSLRRAVENFGLPSQERGRCASVWWRQSFPKLSARARTYPFTGKKVGREKKSIFFFLIVWRANVKSIAKSMAESLAQSMAESMAESMAQIMAQRVAESMSESIAQRILLSLAWGMAKSKSRSNLYCNFFNLCTVSKRIRPYLGVFLLP